MKITQHTLSLNVAEPAASAQFVRRHFGYTSLMSIDGVESVEAPDGGPSIVYLRTGLPTFKPAAQAGAATGLLVAFTVDDIDAQYERLRTEGVPIVTAIETEPWGERYFQTADPNGIVYQLVQWVTADGAPPAATQPSA